MSDNLTNILEHVLETYFHVEYTTDDSKEKAQRFIQNKKFPRRKSQFKQLLSSAILHEDITPERYEDLTGEDLETAQEVKRVLKQLWNDLYEAEPFISDPIS